MGVASNDALTHVRPKNFQIGHASQLDFMAGAELKLLKMYLKPDNMITANFKHLVRASHA